MWCVWISHAGESDDAWQWKTAYVGGSWRRVARLLKTIFSYKCFEDQFGINRWYIAMVIVNSGSACGSEWTPNFLYMQNKLNEAFYCLRKKNAQRETARTRNWDFKRDQNNSGSDTMKKKITKYNCERNLYFWYNFLV
jgi:hypothetical protein